MATDTKDRLSDLPDAMILHILSFLYTMKEIARTSVLSTRWRFLWKLVPLSLAFSSDSCNSGHDISDFVAATNRELHRSRCFQKVRKFSVKFRYEKCYAQDVHSWVYFATQAAKVEDFQLLLNYGLDSKFDFPDFAYKSTTLKNLVLCDCVLNPSGTISWNHLISLSIGQLNLTDGVMEKVLSGCPNLECLQLDDVNGLHHLEISSAKLRKLIIKNCRKVTDGDAHNWLEIRAPYVQHLQVLGVFHGIRLRLKNVASLLTTVLNFTPYLCSLFDQNDDDGDDDDGGDDLGKEYRYVKELLCSLVHVENLELGSWCIEFLSILELKGWQSPASSRRILTLNTALDHQDFPAICNVLQSSPGLETLVIDWGYSKLRQVLSRFIKEDGNHARVENHIFNCSLLHLRTIKIKQFWGPLRDNKFILPLLKYLLKNAEVLEKLTVDPCLRYNILEGSIVSFDFVEMAQELLSYPRSSPHAAVNFSYLSKFEP